MVFSNSSNRWGLAFEEYLESIESYIPQRKPSLEQMEESYHIFFHQNVESSLTCTVLEDVLLLLDCPDKILNMLSSPGLTWHARMVIPTFRALETYMETNEASIMAARVCVT
jgi:hypothetical protein